MQEICLEEVLGISKKRLLSIINATKCPSDTESSDSDSDVEKVEGIKSKGGMLRSNGYNHFLIDYFRAHFIGRDFIGLGRRIAK